ncbi:MAG: glycosyltransferase [Deltaproteobacteria bacterium]
MRITINSSVMIIGQHLTSRTEAVRDFLSGKVNALAVIALGSAFIDKKENHFFYYQRNILKEHAIYRHPLLKKIRSLKIIIPVAFLLYSVDIFRTLMKLKKKMDLFVGISHFSGLIGVFLKRTGICKKTIYYAIDFYAASEGVPFFNRFMARIANFADRLAVIHSDEVWDISPRISEARSVFYGLKKNEYGLRHKVVPLGYSGDFFRHKGMDEVAPNSIVFVGVIVEGQGLELMTDALPLIKRVISGLKINIIGSGPFLPACKRIIKEKGLEDFFSFYGFIEDTDKMLDIVSSSSVGIALWDDRKNKLLNSYFGDPGKTKLYSACGIPVIVSNHTVYSEVITRKKSGVGINYDAAELANALKEILNVENYAAFKRNAIMVGEEYCKAEDIFSQAVEYGEID